MLKHKYQIGNIFGKCMSNKGLLLLLQTIGKEKRKTAGTKIDEEFREAMFERQRT